MAAIVVVLALAGAATALAAARDPGVTAPAPERIARSAVHSVTNAPEADATGGAPWSAHRVSPDSTSTLSETTLSETGVPETGVPSKAAAPPDSPTAPSLVQTGPVGADAVLETVNSPALPEGHGLQVNAAARAARDAAGRNGAGPPAQAAPVTSFDITLSPGANLISLPLVPDDIGIEAVLTGILDRVETVWQYDTSGAVPRWRSYAPGAPSDLRVMRDGLGYWVLLKDGGAGDTVLTVTGREETGPARRVARGWNLVGFTSTSPQSPGEYLGALGGSAGTTMVGYAGGAAAAVLPSAAPPQLIPGRGYWLYVESAGTIGGAPPETMAVPAQGEAILTHDSGAVLEIPPGTTAEAVTVSITEVEPPPSPVEVGRVFDISVVDSGGRDEELRRPVTVRLPYELSPGKEASDVVVLHWNEGLGEWEAVDGGVADPASGTITVRTSDLSELATAELMTLPEFLAEAFARAVASSVDQVVEGTLGEHYRRGPEGGLGFKHLAAFKVSGGTQYFNLGTTLLLDIDDLARVTDEGKANYVTFWVNGTVGAGGFSAAGSLSYGISLFLHQREVNLDDPSFRATFTPLTIDTPVAEISALSFTRGKIHPVSLNNIKRCQTCAGVSWADLSFNAVRAELDIEPYLDILKGVLESYVDGPRVLVPGGQFATALVGNLVVREDLTLKPAVEDSTALFTSYDSPSPDELEKFDLSYGNQFEGVWGGVDLNGDGRGDMVFPAGGNDELFIQVFTDPRQERDYYIERVDVTRGWKIEAVRLLPTALHQAPFIGPANSSTRVKWKVSRDPLAPDEAYATFKLVQDNARYLGLIDRTVDEINIKLWHTRAVADLAVRASGSPAAVGPGETVSYALAVTNDGADRAQDVTVTVEGLNRGGLVLAAARAGNRPLACDVHHSGDIATCGLGALDDGRTVAVALDFNPSFAFKTPESFAATVVFSASSPVYDPGVENNLAEVTTTFQPPAVPDCATGGAVRDAAANPGLAADCEILLAARDILGVGPTRLNWSVDTPINNWYDVTLGGTPQRVTGLVLSGYGLSGTIPPELGGLTGLEYLDLRRNGLSGEIPQELGVLTNLRLLDLGRNGLTGEIPAELGGLPNLKWLHLSSNQLTGCIPEGLRNVANNDFSSLGLPFCMPSASAGDAASDRAALVALYNATGGANWGNHGNWLSNAPMGEWQGVITDSDGRVTELLLFFNQLTGEIPAELGSLTNLTHLYLSGNQLTGEIPAELGNLANLQTLHLSNNQLTGEIPAELGNLANLQTLHLSSNQLTGAIPAELGNLANLQTLHLSNNQLTGEIPAELGNLTNLQTLYLSDNQLTGEIPAELGNLTNLQTLYLSSNQLTGEIPAELGSLTNLQTLHLSSNQLTGEIPAELGSLANLEGLSLSGNRLTGEIPAELGDLTNLEWLDLSSNQLTGEIPAELGSLTNLEVLYLIGNQLTGAIPAELGNLTNLERLDLRTNQLTGEIPAELGDLTNLKGLSLSGNQLTGEIPAELGSLPNLGVLDLRTNRLTGEIPAELGDLTNLKGLSLSGNQLTGEIPAELGNLTNLEGLSLNNNQLTGEIPAELGRLPNLTHLYLSDNQLTGCIPEGLRNVANNDFGLPFCMPSASAGDAASDRAALVALYNATGGANWGRNGNWLSNAPMGEWHGVTTDSDGRVTHLDLYSNQLTGAIPAELGNLTKLELLSLEGNRLTGAIPAELGSLTNLEVLRLEFNQLTGAIPAELGILSNLTDLYLQDNELTGKIPAELGSLSNLTDLYLQDNELTGEIPAELGDLTSLQSLWLQGNQLTGEIPAELGGLTNLTDLDLFSNQLTGEIPAELGSLTNLVSLDLPNNELTGEIPAELGSLTNLAGLYLANNQLTGEIPAELGSLSNLTDLYLQDNELTGEIPAELGSLTNLAGLYLANNQLTGEIPAELGSLSNLTDLYLQDNELTGEIPAELGNLTNLEELHLAGNELTGEIPAELGSLSNLTDLYLQHNELTGEIPAELGSLTNLEGLYLASNQLTGCIPEGLRNIRANDFGQLGLPFCGS